MTRGRSIGGFLTDEGVRDWPNETCSEMYNTLSLPPGRYQYRYVVDGEWREDPVNPDAVSSSIGGRNSVLVVH